MFGSLNDRQKQQEEIEAILQSEVDNEAKHSKIAKWLKELEGHLRNKVEAEQRAQMKEILEYLDMPLNILIIGGTSVGKSSTINAIYGKNKVKIGTNANPETQSIQECQISKNITLYDSPGLGEGSQKDKTHMNKIHNLLTQKDEYGNAKID